MTPATSTRERLAADVHGAHRFAFAPEGHPDRNAHAWDTLAERHQDRWAALVAWLLEPATLKRLNGIAGREKREANAAARDAA